MKTFMMTLMALGLLALAAHAEEAVITMHKLTESGVGDEIGNVRAVDTQYGLLLIPNLHGLAPGLHGFHVHENEACGPGEKDGKMVAGLAAGGHFDPGKTGKHLGPYGNGHLGDLPALFADADGAVTLPVLAPRLKVKDLRGHSLMIHAGGDNYADEPKPLGGGGARAACGTVTE
jgi:Cu-Zn family superoxide dismutase